MYRKFFPALATSNWLRLATRRPPVREPGPPRAEPWERWSLYIGGGWTYAWFRPGRGVSPDHPGPAVMFGHGGWDLVEDWFDSLDPYLHWGLSVLLPEYRGYGEAAGRTVATAVQGDLARHRDRLVRRVEVDAARIVYHGRSVGGAMMAGLAVHRPPAALILQSTFTRFRDLARRFFVPPLLLRDRLDNLEALERITCPCLIVHGERDLLVPVSHAARLHAAALDSRLITFDGVGHNDSPGRRRDLSDPVRAERWHRFWEIVHGFLVETHVLPADHPFDLPVHPGTAESSK